MPSFDQKYWFVVASLWATAMTVHAGQGDAARICEQKWIEESPHFTARAPADYAGLLRHWLEQAPACRGSVVYEARLAVAYSFNQQPEQARQVLASVQKGASPYGYLVELSELVIENNQALKQGLDETRARQLESKFRAFVKAHPTVPEGQAMLGGILTGLDKHEEAIKALRAGLKSSTDLTGVYRNLTVSFVGAGRFKEALSAADEAIGRDRNLSGDAYFVYAVAKANAATGQLKEAETALRLIAAKKPEVRRDPDFKEAVDFVTARIAKN